MHNKESAIDCSITASRHHHLHQKHQPPIHQQKHQQKQNQHLDDIGDKSRLNTSSGNVIDYSHSKAQRLIFLNQKFALEPGVLSLNTASMSQAEQTRQRPSKRCSGNNHHPIVSYNRIFDDNKVAGSMRQPDRPSSQANLTQKRKG